MTMVGYAHASPDDPVCLNQLERLKRVGCTSVRLDWADGGASSRVLRQAVDGLKPGDVLAVAGLDRLGLQADELTEFVERLGARGIHLRSVTPALDTASPRGKAFFGMLAVFAEFRETRSRA